MSPKGARKGKARRRPRKKAKGGRAQKKVRKGPVPKGRSKPPMIPVVLFIVSAAILFSSILLPWGGLDVKTKIGPIPVTLDADVYEYGVKYEADLSGTEGFISAGGNINQKLEEERIFLTGLGKFQETIGFVKGSSKYKNHTIEVYTLPNNYNAKVLVETYADSIPWWPVGVPQKVKLTVKIIEEPVNITHVEIKKVWFELHTTVDGKDVFKKMEESSPGDKLKKYKDSRTYDAEITAEEDWGKFSVVGRAELELIDKDGASNNGRELKSYSGNPKMIDLWTISQDKLVRIVLMLAAFPITLVSGILLLVAMVAALKRRSWAWKLGAAGAILALLSVLFFMLGVGALIDLTGYIDWFQWNYMGIGLAIAGTVLGFASTGAMYKFKPPKARKKKVVKKEESGPEDQEVAEEEEAAGSMDEDALPEDEEEVSAWMPSEE